MIEAKLNIISMKIAIVGKGGSGKSSVSWLLSKTLQQQAVHTLAIDADYNMDLGHNLGWDEDISIPYFSDAEPDFYQYQELSQDVYYVHMPERNMKAFSYRPHDIVTDKYSYPVQRYIDLIVAGPLHDDLLYGHRCSHAYVSALKMYLPLLEKKAEDVVLIDSVAGTDMVGYGMYLGVDAMVCVVENTKNSIGVYHHIKTIAQEFNIPLFAIGNKSQSSDLLKERINEEELLGILQPDTALMSYDYDHLSSQNTEIAQSVLDQLSNKDFDPQLQWKRHKDWKKKYDEQLEENKQKDYTFIEDDKV